MYVGMGISYPKIIISGNLTSKIEKIYYKIDDNDRKYEENNILKKHQTTYMNLFLLMKQEHIYLHINLMVI